MRDKPHYRQFAVALTFLLKDEPQAVLTLLYILWRKDTKTSYADGKWHVQVTDIANRLGRDEK